MLINKNTIEKIKNDLPKFKNFNETLMYTEKQIEKSKCFTFICFIFAHLTLTFLTLFILVDKVPNLQSAIKLVLICSISSCIFSYLLFNLKSFKGIPLKCYSNKRIKSIAVLKELTSIKMKDLSFLKNKDLKRISSNIKENKIENLSVYQRAFDRGLLSLNVNEQVSLVLLELFLEEKTINYFVFNEYINIIKSEFNEDDYFTFISFNEFLNKITIDEFNKNKDNIVKIISNIRNENYKIKLFADYNKIKASVFEKISVSDAINKEIVDIKSKKEYNKEQPVINNLKIKSI